MPNVLQAVAPSTNAAHTALLVGLVAVIAACLVAIVWTTRTEIRRRRRPGQHLTWTQDVLADIGHSFLFASPILLCFAVLSVAREGAAVVPGLLTGGAAALTYALGLPLRLAALANDPDARLLSLHRRRFFATVVRLRKPWLPVLATAPYFAGITLYLALTGQDAGSPGASSFAAGALFGALHVGLLAWGIQCVQVLRALRVEGRRA